MVLIWLVTIGCVWGITNALIRRGAMIAEALKTKKVRGKVQTGGLRACLEEMMFTLCVWQYSIPFITNLLASALFFMKLSDANITLAVPVTNAITFGATAAAGAALGEKMDPLRTMLGIALIIAGVYICVSSS